MVNVNNLLQAAIDENIIIKKTDYLYSINKDADENDIEHFLVTLLHYHSEICILRNDNDTAIGFIIN